MAQTVREYAEAIFMIVMEEGKQNEYGKALDRMLEIFAENPEYVDLLASPAIPTGERIECIAEAFEGFVPEHVLSFVQLLCENGRITSFDECVKEYKKLLDASNKVTVAKIISFVELSDSQKSRLTEKLEKISGNRVQAEYFTDPSVLGGLIIEMDGKIIDGSLSHRLQEVKDVMIR